MSIYIIIIPILLLLFSYALIFPNIQAKCFGLFPENGGIAGAVYGFFTIAGGSALLTIFAKTLPTNSQIPMAYYLSWVAFIMLKPIFDYWLFGQKSVEGIILLMYLLSIKTIRAIKTPITPILK